MGELDGRRLRAADLITGIVLAALGAGMLLASLAMPTYADRGTILTAPGIFPGFVAAAILALGGVLALRAFRSDPSPGDEQNLVLAPVLKGLALMVAAIALIGVVDFRLVIGGFCVAFAALFVNWRGSRAEIMRRLAATLLVVVIAAVLLPEGFEQIFLVRLP